RAWKLEDAKNRFSEVVREAAREPQLVTKNGRDAVVVMSVEAYARLVVPRDLAEFLRESPLAEALAEGLELSRSADPGRDVDV
ncbi:MAG: type II toxin-antitoxin system prevent-host-death family antitoxin, partial [Gemmatimonadetes bacterium]|nr:type II toxin-antitoxin system prevent-host-death family antitoxin [Gemmatimonadota bacterium]